jgi:hypothetical protein
MSRLPGFACDEVVLGNRDQLGPAALVDGRVRMEKKAEHLVAHPIAADAITDPVGCANSISVA